MKIYYILKKGIQCYPPCLAQILYLDDLGAELEVYHGQNSDVVNNILNQRGIKHHTLKSDRTNTNKFQSMQTFLSYTLEIRKEIRKMDSDCILWFGNCESVITVGNKILKKKKFVLSVLELYEPNSFIGKRLKKFINKAKAVLCCEKHRASIMKVYYNLDKEPYVLPNKPYELADENIILDAKTQEKLEDIKNKFIIIYQGIITPDRPLDKIALALNKINDSSLYFLILGKANKEYQKEMQSKYKNTVFLGYVPSPQHLLVTKYANIGIANYDYSNLNNVFCAPNKIYEYSKFAIPMLVSQNIGLSETVGAVGAAVCVDFLNVEQIAKGITIIRDNYSDYSKAATAFYNGTSNYETMKEIVNNI